MQKKLSFINKIIIKLKNYLKKPLNSKFSYKHFSSVFLWSKFSGKNINTKKYWDEIHFKENESPANRFDKMVLSFLNNISFKNKDVLDVGCGRGYFLSQLKDAKSLTGIDISEEAIKIVNEKKINGHVRILPHINLEKKFDIISSFETIEHVKEWKQSINEMINLLNDNAYLLLSVPFENSIVIEEHVSYFDLPRLYKTLNKSLTVLEIKIIGPWILLISQNKKFKNGEIPDYYLKNNKNE